MDEHYEPEETSTGGQGPHGMFWLAFLAFVVVLGVAAVGMYNSYRQKSTIDQLTAQASNMNATMSQLQNRLDTTTAKLNDFSAAQAVARTAATQAVASAAKSGTRTVAGPSRAELNRLKQLQSRLEDQQQQLQSTQDDVTKTRSDLQGNLDSTRDRLTGSIAKTHDELVTLEKRGEHRYFEFDLTRSKQFMREGPVSLMLRRNDPKHSNVDLTVLVNDKQITKKRVNLYEPVSIYRTDNGEPLQVVVNKIDAKGVHGYVSAPRYTAADLSASAAPAAAPETTSTATPRVTPSAPQPPSPNTNSNNTTTEDPNQ